MEVTCARCNTSFDDADCSTICPHKLIMPKEDLDRKKLAISLMDKPIRFHHMPPDSRPTRITTIMWNGMVEVEGMSGEFAPHLFTVHKANK